MTLQLNLFELDDLEDFLRVKTKTHNSDISQFLEVQRIDIKYLTL